MITISLCMIVKNEEAVLARCLDSICDLMDEIIIVDTGSTDSTKEIARRYTDKIFDFTWNGDFSAARNFSFSKASMDYIYTADADEVLDTENRKRFLTLKKVLLSEIEIVQMKYVTKTDFNTVMNFQKEYRPKLYKRLRSFTWVDPIHETVRLNPVVFDSDIEILHMPPAPHQKRDFSVFRQTFERDGVLSKKIQRMYAKELFISGEDTDFFDAAPVFEAFLSSPAADTEVNADLSKEASLVLLHIARLKENEPLFFQYSLNDMLTTPCAESCMEIGEYFYSKQLYETAIMWFYNAAFEAESILDVHSSGNLPLKRLSDCYLALAEQLEKSSAADADTLSASTDSNTGLEATLKEYREAAASYLAQSEKWTLPEA